MGEDSLPVLERMLFLKQTPPQYSPILTSRQREYAGEHGPEANVSIFQVPSRVPGSIDSRPTPRSVLEALHLLGLRPVDAGNAERLTLASLGIALPLIRWKQRVAAVSTAAKQVLTGRRSKIVVGQQFAGNHRLFILEIAAWPFNPSCPRRAGHGPVLWLSWERAVTVSTFSAGNMSCFLGTSRLPCQDVEQLAISPTFATFELSQNPRSWLAGRCQGDGPD
ncbi:hypothetical protein Landi51_00206 [Colletotrichum acutatum]